MVRFARWSSESASATSTVCMNFLAIPTLKNVRACFLLPISIIPLRSLKVTFERERMGIEIVGSFCRCAAVTTVSATLTSFLSTTLGFFSFFLAMTSPISSFA